MTRETPVMTKNTGQGKKTAVGTKIHGSGLKNTGRDVQAFGHDGFCIGRGV